MQADAYAGFNKLYHPSRKPGAIIEAACWAHARRKFFDLARLQKAPIAIEAVKRIDALFAIEREINGKTPLERVRVRNEHSRPLVNDLETWLREQRRKLSSKSDTAKAINYSLQRWPALTRFLNDGGCACPTMPPSGRCAASRSAPQLDLRRLRRRRHRAAAMYTLIETAKLNDIDPQAWLADVLARVHDHAAKRINELLPWNWRPPPRSLKLPILQPNTAHRQPVTRAVRRLSRRSRPPYPVAFTERETLRILPARSARRGSTLDSRVFA